MTQRPLIIRVLLFFLCAATVPGRAQQKTEGDLVMQVLNALVNKDAIAYSKLFPDVELMSKTILQHTDTASRAWNMMAYLSERPDEMAIYERRLDSALMSTFNNVLDEAAKMNIHWQHVLFARFELEKQRETRDHIYEKLAPERFRGYVFIKDPVGNDTYCFTVGDLVKIQGQWYGGTLQHIFEADTKFGYDLRLMEYAIARKKNKPFVWKKNETDDPEDSTASAEEQEKLTNAPQKTIVERKYYTGTFDNEIPVQLYIRYIKGTCPEGVCAYEAIFKFGDQDDYVHMSVVKTDDRWVFSEDPGSGVMDLKFKEGVYTGSWTSTTDQTGYEVQISETVPGNKKLKFLDEIFQMELWKKTE